MEIQIFNRKNEKAYLPLVEGEIVWETERRGSPGKLTFNVIRDGIVNFQEGDAVAFTRQGHPIFFGFIFSKSRDKEHIIKVTAYDQLRYLKNKATYKITNQKTSDFIKKIASDFQLKVGHITDTEYVIPSLLEDNKTLMDMIYTTLDLTLDHRGKLYVLYDNYKEIELKNIEEMKIKDLILGDETVENFSYKTDIDQDTYNFVKLDNKDEETAPNEPFVASDPLSMKQWGILQYYDVLEDGVNGQAKADTILKLKNRVNRTLSLTNCLGDIRVRGGSGVMISMKDIGDMSLNQYMLVEKCKHSFKKDEHFMTLDLRGNL